MSKKIYSELTPDLIRRMRNWARARYAPTLSAGGAIYQLGVGVDRYRDVNETFLYGEAADTWAAMKKLPGRYKQVVQQFWIHEKESMVWHALQRKIDRETFEIWVIKGHELLKQKLKEQDEHWRRHHRSWKDAGAGV